MRCVYKNNCILFSCFSSVFFLVYNKFSLNFQFVFTTPAIFPIFLFSLYFPISSNAYNLENLIIYFSLRSFVCAQVSSPLKEKLNYLKMFSWSKIPSEKVHGFTNSVLCCSSQFSSQLTRFFSLVYSPLISSSTGGMMDTTLCGFS